MSSIFLVFGDSWQSSGSLFLNLFNWCNCSRKNSVSLLMLCYRCFSYLMLSSSVHRWDLELLPNTGMSTNQSPAGAAGVSLPCLRQALHLSFVWALCQSCSQSLQQSLDGPRRTRIQRGSIRPELGPATGNPPGQGLAFQSRSHPIKSFYTEISFSHWETDAPLWRHGESGRAL